MIFLLLQLSLVTAITTDPPFRSTEDWFCPRVAKCQFGGSKPPSPTTAPGHAARQEAPTGKEASRTAAPGTAAPGTAAPGTAAPGTAASGTSNPQGLTTAPSVVYTRPTPGSPTNSAVRILQHQVRYLLKKATETASLQRHVRYLLWRARDKFFCSSFNVPVFQAVGKPMRTKRWVKLNARFQQNPKVTVGLNRVDATTTHIKVLRVTTTHALVYMYANPTQSPIYYNSNKKRVAFIEASGLACGIVRWYEKKKSNWMNI